VEHPGLESLEQGTLDALTQQPLHLRKGRMLRGIAARRGPQPPPAHPSPPSRTRGLGCKRQREAQPVPSATSPKTRLFACPLTALPAAFPSPGRHTPLGCAPDTNRPAPATTSKGGRAAEPVPPHDSAVPRQRQPPPRARQRGSSELPPGAGPLPRPAEGLLRTPPLRPGAQRRRPRRRQRRSARDSPGAPSAPG